MTVWAGMIGLRSFLPLLLATLLSGIPAMMLLFISFYGFGGVLNH